jgi:hypothetical protein
MLMHESANDVDLRDKSKTVAIMQPYLFPYVGYYQLISRSDVFVVLDTVQFIRRGWMNRNRIFVDGAEWRFTIPVVRGSQTDLIKDKKFAPEAIQALKSLRNTISRAYRKSEFTPIVESLIDKLMDRILSHDGMDFTGAVTESIIDTISLMELNVQVIRASDLNCEGAVGAENRIIEICTAVGACKYINMVNGANLYNEENFNRRNLSLDFLSPHLPHYCQQSDNFIPNLSILDVIANIGPMRASDLVTDPRLEI